ncbi:hypothetical protein [Adlercreutzia murintestinalis]|jgi:hypothetical protein|uniref:hypothetical protein n=1 Tax=Adlercreutzia murintestinalis TaxID=2941325 RepID=UPI00203A7266|nr:hypothetical protein [Adlercreutzia murintestinalis]
MVSEHALLVLILLLAVAVVILAMGLWLSARRMDEQLKRIEHRLAARGTAQTSGSVAQVE